MITPVFRDDLDFAAANPFAPGTSPFRMKGRVFQDAVGHFGRSIPGGLPAFLDAADPRYAAFFSQSFLPGSWYDAYPAAYSGYLVARMLGRPFADVTVETLHEQATRNITGVYKVVLKFLVSPLAVAMRMSAITEQLSDFAPVDCEQVSKTEVVIMRSKFPAPLFHWYELVGNTFVEIALKAAGAKNIVLEPIAPIRDGTQNGVDLVRFGSRVKWV
jgi:hypothetical protein